MCGDICLHLLQLITITVGCGLFLYVGHICLRQLIDDLVEEGGGTYCRFQYLEVKQVIGLALALAHLIHYGLDGVFDGAAGEHLGSIVGS